MDRYINAIRKMRDGSCMLIDGATATELERRGVPQLNNAWNGGGALSHPDILKNIHSEYIKLGAKLIISNTFATCKHTLEDAKQSHNFQKLNSEGVRIAIEARSELNADEVLVAGGISYWSFTGRDPSLSRLKVNIYEQAYLLADSGADLLILEMMKDIESESVDLILTDLPYGVLNPRNKWDNIIPFDCHFCIKTFTSKMLITRCSSKSVLFGLNLSSRFNNLGKRE